MKVILNNKKVDLRSKEIDVISLIRNEEVDFPSLRLLHRAYVAREAFFYLKYIYSDKELCRIMDLQYDIWMKYDLAEPVIYDALVELLNTKYTLNELERMTKSELYDAICTVTYN